MNMILVSWGMCTLSGKTRSEQDEQFHPWVWRHSCHRSPAVGRMHKWLQAAEATPALRWEK